MLAVIFHRRAAFMKGLNIWSVLLSTVTVFAVVYGGLMGLMAFFQAHLIYFPDAHHVTTPDREGLPYDPVTFSTKDGCSLDGWYIPAGKARGTVLFCHGNAGNISHRIDSIRLFHDLDMNVFIYDYRGYGKSTGKTTEKGTYGDAEAAWRYITDVQGIDGDTVVIFGRSLGGAVAAYLAAKMSPRALIVESSFTSVPALGAEIYRFFPVRILSRFDYPTIHFIADISCPVLVAHSTDDDIIPYGHGRELYAAAREPKWFLDMRGSHNEGFYVSGEAYRTGLDVFLTHCLGGMSKSKS